MTNKQPDKSVEETATSCREGIEMECTEPLTPYQLRKIYQAVYATIQAERQRCEEVVKAERERILEMIGHLPYVSQEEYKKYKNGGIIKWVTLKEHFTQPNNTK